MLHAALLFHLLTGEGHVEPAFGLVHAAWPFRRSFFRLADALVHVVADRRRIGGLRERELTGLRRGSFGFGRCGRLWLRRGRGCRLEREGLLLRRILRAYHLLLLARDVRHGGLDLDVRVRRERVG